MVLYWGFLIWGFSKPHLGIFYGSSDFQGFSIRGFSIWGFSYTIMKAHVNQAPCETVNDRECEDSVIITFQILTINNVSLRASWITSIYLNVYQLLLVNC